MNFNDSDRLNHATAQYREAIVFVNSARVAVAQGATVLDAVRAWNEQEAAAFADGDRVVTDSRGLPVPADTPVHGGAIFRILPARSRPESNGS